MKLDCPRGLLLSYECLKSTTCDCINGTCGWKINDEYLDCMQAYEENKSKYTCVSDNECVPSDCCHPTYCINNRYAPNCTDSNCTQTCDSVLDCNGGECICYEEECMVRKLNTSAST